MSFLLGYTQIVGLLSVGLALGVLIQYVLLLGRRRIGKRIGTHVVIVALGQIVLILLTVDGQRFPSVRNHEPWRLPTLAVTFTLLLGALYLVLTHIGGQYRINETDKTLLKIQLKMRERQDRTP